MDTVEDNKQRLKNLIEFSQKRREWYQDLGIKIADRQSDQISLISSISAAILAITASFTFERNIWVNISFWSLLVTVVLGVVLLLLLISLDREVATEDRRIELDILDRLKESTKKAIREYPLYQNQHIADFKSETKKIEDLPIKQASKKRVLDVFYFVFLGSFLFGVFGLVRAWLEKGGVLINMSLIIFAVIVLASILLGYTWYLSIIQDETENREEKLLRNSSPQRKFKDFWAYFINFIIGGSIGYYLVDIRWNYIKNSGSLSTGDLFLIILFVVSMFGHLPVLSHNITKGVEAIISRVMERK